MEFIIGGSAASVAVLFTNPLEVVKTRFQLQGELKGRGQYTVHYRHVLHAFYVIAKADGIWAMQKGLGPAVAYQTVLNGTRLGLAQVAEEKKWLLGPKGEISLLKTLGFSTLTGAMSGVFSSPFYLIKVHLQAKADKSIAVGYQHEHRGTLSALSEIYKEHGLKGLFRGVSAGTMRIILATCIQLPAFDLSKEYLKKHPISATPGGILDSFVAAMIGGLAVTALMAPLDVVSTRFYNQGVDANGKGILYKNIVDCMVKSYRKEGFFGLYKGFIPCYFRVGPYNLITFVCWDALKSMQKNFVSSTRLEAS